MLLWLQQALQHHRRIFDTSEIHVTGQASRSVAPTYAILTLGITSENTNINAAKSNNDRIMSDLISRLSNLNVAKKDVYTSNISVSPTNDYQEGKRVNTGYRVSNLVTMHQNGKKTVVTVDGNTGAYIEQSKATKLPPEPDQGFDKTPYEPRMGP